MMSPTWLWALGWLLFVLTASVIVLERQRKPDSELRNGCLGIHLCTTLGLGLALRFWLSGEMTPEEAGSVIVLLSVCGGFLCLAYWMAGLILNSLGRFMGTRDEEKQSGNFDEIDGAP